MPKAAAYCLTWSPARGVYELSESQSKQVLPVVPGSHEWFAWLATVPSFTFSGQTAQLTVRQESRPRGGRYWYASRRIGAKMTKRYLGKTSEVTLVRLEQIAQELWAAADETGNRRQEARALPDHALSLLSSGVEGKETITRNRQRTETSKPRDPLLATKLRCPRPRSRLIARVHLTERLQQGMGYALTLLSAPAGFGKTTLLAQWLAERKTPVAWLSLEPEDNEPVRFFFYLLTALQTLHPRLGSVAGALLEASQAVPLERVLILLINDILEQALDDFVLVLDDYHVIKAEAIQQGMAFLLGHLPPQMHLVLATRTDPPLPLVRLRARGQLTEVRATDLRLNTNEAGAFLHTVMGLDLPAPAITVLERRTEGWIAGLQFAALSLQGRTDVSAFLSTFTGTHRFVLDYLSEEVLSRQSASVQSFLLSTSILERLSGPLCDAVTGQQESQARLSALDQANLFVVSLDDERHWFRYHHLFAEVLSTRLRQTDPSLVLQLHLRASRWYEQQGLFAEAVHHALAASDVERAADLIEHIDIGSWAGHGTHVQRMLGWLSRLPESLVCTRPILCIVHGVALMFTNQLPQAETCLQAAERCLVDAKIPDEQVRLLRSIVVATRGVMARFSGDLASSVALAQQALVLLPHNEVTPGQVARLNVTHAFLVTGDVTAPQERFVVEIVGELQTSDNQSLTMRSLTNLAQLQIVQGRLHQAVATFEKVARVAQQEDMQVITGSLVYYIGLADVLREWNELNQAEHLLKQGMQLVEGGLTAEGEVITLGYITLARLQMARFEYGQALIVLDTFTHLADTHSFAPHLIARAIALRAHIALVQGNLRAALSWVEQCGIKASDNDLSYLREREYLTLARVRIAQGREDPSAFFFQDVSQLLDRLLQDAEAKARRSSVLELLLLQALALAAQDEQNAAFSPLERALSLAEPEGYVRLFVDEGASMRDLLRQALARGITPHYVGTLLAAFGESVDGTEARSPSHAGPLIEPLTKREREVLQLLAEGDSNREIAQRLIVSIGTVKKHVYNICGKLGVQSRMQVLARARALHLL